MPTTTALIEPKTKIVGANHTDIQISANPWNQSRVVTGGATGGLFTRDSTQTDGWGLVDAAAGVLRCGGAGTLPAWSSDGAGIWVPVAYSAANFTAGGSMTWTVDAGDQTRFAYQLNNKTLIMSFWLDSTTIGGTVANELRLAIPAGKTVAGFQSGLCCVNNPGSALGIIFAFSGNAYIKLLKADQSNFALGTNNVTVSGTFQFEVN